MNRRFAALATAALAACTPAAAPSPAPAPTTSSPAPAPAPASAPASAAPARATSADTLRPRLPTGVMLDPEGAQTDVAALPLALLPSPDGRQLVLLASGWKMQGFQVVDRASGQVTQTVEQPAAFVGLAFSPDGRTLYASGGNQDVVYRYAWAGGRATLRDSLVLAVKARPRDSGTRYPAGLGVSPDGRRLYVAENMADSLAVVDVATGRVLRRLATEPYPYGVAVSPAGTVYVSAWGGGTVSVFTPTAAGAVAAGRIAAGRHPSALLLSRDGRRLFAASGSTDRVAVIDTRARRVVAELLDAPPASVEGATPNALALSPDGTRLFAAEGDANAVAVFDLSAATSGIASARGNDRLAGRVPSGWYPSAVLALGDSLIVANGKGRGTGPNPDGPQPSAAGMHLPAGSNSTLNQVSGTLSISPHVRASGAALAALTARVTRANGWDRPVGRTFRYPPFRHVVYVIKENRTYDQVLGDLGEADGDTMLLFFGPRSAPNHKALARRFGIYDRFFVNAEVSPDGHNWSTAAYTTDYLQKTVPSNYSDRGRSYDYEGTNRGTWENPIVPDDDVAEPARGYLWNLAERRGITFRNYGEFVVGVRSGGRITSYRGTKPFLARNTHPQFPGFDLAIPDQRRADIWIAELQEFARSGQMPALEVVRLPNDHTSGARAGRPNPRAAFADNDLALGRMVEALSKSPFWESTVMFVVEDDAQNGPDHVDSHRSPFWVISAWNRPGVVHRFANTTDVIRTMEEILGLESLSHFDGFGRPLREIWAATPDLSPYTALIPAQPLDEMNPTGTALARASARLDLRTEDVADEDDFNRILWEMMKGPRAPYPGATRMPALEMVRR